MCFVCVSLLSQRLAPHSIPNVTAGHSNRVFSLKFCPDDENLLVSGGWDNTVQVWDIRVGHSVRSIFGPHVAGDSVDVTGQTVLTGSWRPEKCLQVRLAHVSQWVWWCGCRYAVPVTVPSRCHATDVGPGHRRAD